jgi:hypothetical protein
MAKELKTKKNTASVSAFIGAVEDEQKRKDCKAIMKMMKSVTGKSPKMWGKSIVGYDSYHYVYASGKEGDWPIIGFSPRAKAITLYIMSGFDEYTDLMKKLGKHKTGKSCLYIKTLEDVDLKVLERIMKKSVAWMKKQYPDPKK